MGSNVAKKVISSIGGVGRVQEITGLNRSQIHRWTYTKEKGGTGGIIPACWHMPLITGARELFKIQLPLDLFFDLDEKDTTNPG